MCGICLIMKIKFNKIDFNILKDIENYNNLFDDSYIKNNNLILNKEKENIKEENIINNNIFKKDNILDEIEELFNFDINELIKLINKRGPDFINICELDSYNNNLSDFTNEMNKIQTYINLFNYINKNNSKILIDSVLSLRGIKSLTKHPIKINENILQYNGEIYNILDQNYMKDIQNRLIYDNDGIILSEILYNFSKENLNKNNEEYSNNLFKIINNIESDHVFIYHDILNKKIVINKDIFGKKSLILIYIKKFDILFFVSVVPNYIYKLREYKNDILIYEIPNNHILLIDLNNNNIDKQNLYLFKNNDILFPSFLRFNDKIQEINSYDNLEKSCSIYLNNAINKRINNLPELIMKNNDNYAIGIMFSGGIDSLIMAYYTIINSPNNINIDLFNLSFEKNSPDRNSGILSYYELINKFPNRKINLILIDKIYDVDLTEEISNYHLNLIYPSETHMDFNIASALKFASQKKGYLVNKEKMLKYFSENYNNIFIPQNSINLKNYNNNILSKQISNINYDNFINKEENMYISNCKIILDGLGADEIFGGYSRYKNGDLKEHISQDLNRIFIRNFGRDDRVCSDNGIELRFPYFDLDLIKFLSSIKNLKYISNFELQRGIGEKCLLRNIGKLLGFEKCYMFEKRAIQFGTKLAHETNKKKYGSNRKANGKAQFK